MQSENEPPISFAAKVFLETKLSPLACFKSDDVELVIRWLGSFNFRSLECFVFFFFLTESYTIKKQG